MTNETRASAYCLLQNLYPGFALARSDELILISNETSLWSLTFMNWIFVSLDQYHIENGIFRH